MTTNRAALALAALLAAAPAAFAASSAVTIQGIDLEAPAGFVKSDVFTGLQEAETGSSIMITVMRAPIAETAKLYSKEALESQGVQFLGSEEIPVGGVNGTLIEARQKAYDTEFGKWLLLFGDGERTALVMATYPAESEESVSPVLKKALMSARWNASGASVDPYEGLRFSVAPPPTLKFAQRLSNTLMFTADGKTQGQPATSPLYLLGASITRIMIDDLKSFSTIRIGRAPGAGDIVIASEKEVEISGLKGWELTADAKDATTGDALKLYQTILYDTEESIYYVMQGRAGGDKAAAALDEFREITSTFRLKK